MPIFRYQGRDNNGKKVDGTFEASNTSDVVSYLHSKNITPLNIHALKQGNKWFSNFSRSEFVTGKVKPAEVMNFCRQMATLGGAGVPTIDSIKQLALSSSSKAFGRALDDVAKSLVAGKNLATSLREHPNIFPLIFTSIVDVGENTGHLEEAFLQLANYTEISVSNRRKLVAAVRYPITVIVASLIAIIVINVFVVPKFTAIYASFKTELPVPTKILMAISGFLINYWIPLAIVSAIVIFGTPFLLRIPQVRYIWDKYKLKLPIFGNLQKQIILTQFTWTFGLIIRSGVPIIKGLTLAANTAGNAYFTQQILAIRDGIDQGQTLLQATTSGKIFPPSVLQMIGVGEETGRLDNILTEVARYYERESDFMIKRLNDLMEPLLLTIIGVMVVMLALGVYLPMWDMVKFVQH